MTTAELMALTGYQRTLLWEAGLLEQRVETCFACGGFGEQMRYEPHWKTGEDYAARDGVCQACHGTGRIQQKMIKAGADPVAVERIVSDEDYGRP